MSSTAPPRSPRRRSRPPMSGTPSMRRRGDTPRPSTYVPPNGALAAALRALNALEGAERILAELGRLDVPGTSTAIAAALVGARRAQAEVHGITRRLAAGGDEPHGDGEGAPPTKRS